MVLAIPMRRICEACGVHAPYWKCCVPIYNLVLLGRAVELPQWILLLSLGSAMLLPFTPLANSFASTAITFLYFGTLSAAMAERYQKNRVLWGIVGGILFFIPLIFFSRATVPEEIT